MITAIGAAIRAAHEYMNPNPLEAAGARSSASATPSAAARTVLPDGAVSMLPPEIVTGITQKARQLYFEDLHPKYAALAAASLGAEARLSPNLHRYLREHTLRIEPNDDARTVATKIEAFKVLALHLPAVNREPGEDRLPDHQRSAARADLTKLLLDNNEECGTAQAATRQRLTALTDSTQGEKEWFETCGFIGKLLKDGKITPNVARQNLVTLTKKLNIFPFKYRKMALPHLAQLHDAAPFTENDNARQRLEFQTHLRKALMSLEIPTRIAYLRQFGLDVLSPRETLEGELSRLEQQKRALETNLRNAPV